PALHVGPKSDSTNPAHRQHPPQPMPKRNLTNDYQDCHLIKLDPHDLRSPIVVTQEGCAPDDPLARTRLFYLQRDGQWIDEIARSTRPDTEAGEIVFERTGEAV